MTVSVDVGPTVQLVESKFTSSQSLAEGLWRTAQGFLGKMQGGDYSFDLDGLDISIPDLDTNIGDPQVPAALSADFQAPDIPSYNAPDSVDLGGIDVPDCDSSKPSIDIPSTPNPHWPEDPGDAPSLTDIDIPADPNITLPDAPYIGSVELPNPPELSSVSFEGNCPIMNINIPQTLFEYDEAVYTSSIQDGLTLNLLELMKDGTGLPDDVEEALWQRGQNRQRLKNEQMYVEAETYYSSRGFTLPPGGISGRLAEIQKEIANQNAQLNYEILIEQARLTQENRRFAITAAIQFDVALMQHFDAVANRALDAAKYVQKVAIDIFNSQIALQELKLSIYQTEAKVFETKVQATLLELEEYKICMEGAKVQIEAGHVQAKIYQSKIEAYGQILKMYNSQVEAAKIKGEIEQLKIEGYKQTVNAYGAKVNAIVANFNAYQAEVAGEKAKAEVYATEVQAYSALVGGVKVKGDIEVAKVQAKIANNQMLLDGYKASIEGYKAEVVAASKESEVKAVVHSAQADMYKSEILKSSEEMRSKISRYAAESTHSTNVARIGVEQARLCLEEASRRQGLENEVTKSSATIAAQMAASALSAVAAGAQISYRASLGGEIGEFYNHNLNV